MFFVIVANINHVVCRVGKCLARSVGLVLLFFLTVGSRTLYPGAAPPEPPLLVVYNNLACCAGDEGCAQQSCMLWRVGVLFFIYWGPFPPNPPPTLVKYRVIGG